MPYLNSRLCALLAMGLSLVVVPGLGAQDASSAPTVIRGDVDGDGRVTRADADAVRAFLVRGTLPNGRTIMPAGDANGDGRVTSADAALISRFAAGVDVSRFPVGRPVGAEAERVVGSALISTEYECNADFRSGSLTCGPVSPTGAEGVRLDLMLGIQAAKIVNMGGGSYSGGDKNNPDTMTYNLALQNLIPQPIGTTDGTTADTSRLVITSYRLVTSPLGIPATAQLTTADGVATFVDSLNYATDSTFTNVEYMNYPGLLTQNSTSSPKFFRFVFSPSVTSMKFTYRTWTRVQYLHGYVTITPADSVVGAGQTLALTGTAFTALGAPGGAVTWSSSDPVVASVDATTGVVTGVAGGTATITATSTADSRRTATRAVYVIQAFANSFDVTGNVRLATPPSVLDNDLAPVPATVGFYGWAQPGKTEQGGTVVMDPAGDFTYDPPAGYNGVDSLMYTIVSGSSAVDTAKVTFTVNGMIWFVGTGGATPCDPNAAGADDKCGRLRDPYPTLADFQADNTGAGKPKAGDAIFLYDGTHAASATLLPQQRLIGQDAVGDGLATIAGITLAAGSDPLPTMTAGTPTTIAGGVGLANVGSGTVANNTVRGLSIRPSAAATVALSGTSFGTLTVDDLIINHSLGQALSLTTGTFSGGLDSLSSGGGTHNVLLSSVKTSGPVTLGAAANGLAGASGDAFRITGEDGSFTYPGSISNSVALSRAANVSDKTGGTVTFSGAITSTTAGSGILVSNNTGATINFPGNINLGGTGPGITVASNGAGTAVNFSGTAKAISSATSAGVSLTGNNAGTTIAFTNGGLTVNTTTGAGFTATVGGTVTVTGAGNSIASTTGTPLSLSSVSTGPSVMSLASVSANGAVNGIVLSGITGAGVQVSGGTIQSTTGPAVSLANLSGITGQVELTGMTLSRSSGTGAVISGTTFGTLALGGTTVSATGGPRAIDLTTGSLAGTITSISASAVTAGTHAVSLTGVGGTYTVSGGTVNGTTNGDALRVSGGSAAATWNNTLSATVSGGRSVNIASTTGGSYTFANTVTAGNGSAGVSITGNAGSVTMPGLTLGTSGARFSATPLTLQMGAGNVSLGAVSIFTTGGSATGLGMTSAAGAGTLSVASGTIDAVGSPAVNIAPSSGTQPVTISLTTVNANGGARGVTLSGTSGSFAVTGTGAANSGGTIQSMSGNGVHLASASNVSLTSVNITNNNGNGVYGDQLTNFALTGSQVTNNDADHPTQGAIANESGLFFNTLLGTNTVRGSTISGTRGDGIRWEANSGAQGSLRVVKSTLGPNPVGTGANGIAITGINNASVTVAVDSSLIQGNQTSGFLTSFANTAAYNLSVRYTKFDDNNIGIDHGIGGGNGTFVFQHDTVVNHRSNAINIISDATSSGTTKANGTVTNNVIGNGTALSGSETANGIGIDIRGDANVAMTVQNNLVRNTLAYPMIVENRLSVSSGRADFIISGNTLNPAEDPFTSFEGIRVTSRDNRTTCLNISGNTSTGSNGIQGIRVRQANTAVFQLEGFAGTGTSTASVADFLDAPRNTSTAAVQSAGTGTIVSYTTGTCLTAAF